MWHSCIWGPPCTSVIFLLCVFCGSTAPLSVRVSPKVEVRALGSAVEFTCGAIGGADIRLEWLKEGGVLPPNHHINNGVLRFVGNATDKHYLS